MTKNKPYISVVIPTYKRESLLLWNLRELANQTLDSGLFEVIVVSDGEELSGWFVDALRTVPGSYRFLTFVQEKSGPASARNVGAQEASGKVILFVGDDTIPDRNLLWRHYYMHYTADKPVAVQGYTEWHPDIPPDDFMKFLTGDSGIQSNWKSLKDESGTWKREATNWFMTTNCSVDRREFLAESGFCLQFPDPAWEDIELGFRFTKRGLTTLFCPDAINYHYHKIVFDQYVNRQIMEGRSRLILCSQHPEVTPAMISPENLRNLDESTLPQSLQVAKDVLYLRGPDVENIKKQRWFTAMQVASLVGVNQAINERPRYWQVLKHIHTEDEIRHTAGVCAALDRGDITYAHFELMWAMQNKRDNWALNALGAEVSVAYNDLGRARIYTQEAVKLGAGEVWVKELTQELL